MKRYKTIDMIRGLAMIIMVGGHMLDWWLTEDDYWLFLFLYSFLAPIGASGFVFISGTVTFLSYQRNMLRPEASDKLFRQKLRDIYIFRALFLLIISFIYNIVGAFVVFGGDIRAIWMWNILQTLSFSFFMAWPLLKTSKILRLILAIIIIILNELILGLIKEHIGEANIYGFIFYILYFPLYLYPILPFFTIFLIGTIVGDLIHNLNLIEDKAERESAFKKKFIYPFILLGSVIALCGILYLFPSFLYYSTLSATFYAIGVLFLLISITLGLEEFEIFKLKKSYRFFFYYSYYSFTIYIAHNPLFFLFYRQLTVITIWIVVIPVLFIITILIRIMYIKLGAKASLKVGISVVSFLLATQLEKRRKRKILGRNK